MDQRSKWSQSIILGLSIIIGLSIHATILDNQSYSKHEDEMKVAQLDSESDRSVALFQQMVKLNPFPIDMGESRVLFVPEYSIKGRDVDMKYNFFLLVDNELIRIPMIVNE